ncbi:MAG: S1 RNA-binding domain-containing protein, partial [Phycisphaeraceae bacterium]
VGGIRAFMPASQIDLHHVGELEPFIGQKLQGSVQEIDRKARKVLLSRRSFLEREKRVKEEKLWKEIEVGQVRDGTVSSVMEYGVFVDIGGADGLVHVSDMSYSRVDKPGDVVKPGEAVKVKVLKLDAEKKRISLGLKQVAPDPWDTAAQQLAVGQQVTGTVRRLADFGAFVEVQPGVDGLLPVSELSWKRIGKPADVVKEGEVLRVVVLQVDPAKHRLTLSLKQAAGDPWVGAEHKYPRHALVAGTVLSTTDFGAFIEIEAGLEGLVHISELADRRVGQVTDVLKIGQQHQFRVLEVDEDNRRIKLSLKAVSAPVEEASQPVTKDAGKVAAPAGKPAAKSRKRSDLKGGMSGNMLGTGLGDLKL